MTAPDGFWSTDDAAPGMGLSYWIEAICEAFLEMKADGDRDNFSAQLTKFQFGPIDLNFVDTDPQEVWRTRAAVARSRENFFYLLYMHGGHMGVAQGSREAVIAPGNCAAREQLRTVSLLPARPEPLPVRADSATLAANMAAACRRCDHHPACRSLALGCDARQRARQSATRCARPDRTAVRRGRRSDRRDAGTGHRRDNASPMTPHGSSLLRRLTRTIEEQSCRSGDRPGFGRRRARNFQTLSASGPGTGQHEFRIDIDRSASEPCQGVCWRIGASRGWRSPKSPGAADSRTRAILHGVSGSALASPPPSTGKTLHF